MTRPRPQPRACQVANKARVHIDEVKHLTIWGNHSATQYPTSSTRESTASAAAVIDDEVWLADDFIPTVAKRGAAIIEARGLSSAASAANAAIDHVNSWMNGTPEGDWTSAAVVSDGSYGVAEGIISSSPVSLATASGRSFRGSRSTTSRVHGLRRPLPNSLRSAKRFAPLACCNNGLL